MSLRDIGLKVPFLMPLPLPKDVLVRRKNQERGGGPDETNSGILPLAHSNAHSANSY